MVCFITCIRVVEVTHICTENPFTAAQKFLEKNDMPLTYIDQVAQFIEKNTGGVNLGGNDNFVDPYTGKLMLKF